VREVQHVVEPDESAWVYLAARRGDTAAGQEAFARRLSDVCVGFGFAVFPGGDDRAGPSGAWLEALRHAEVCVIELSAASAIVGAELAVACCSGRPLVTLRRHQEETPAALRAMLADHPATREVAFEDPAECTEKLRRLFGDPAWQQLVRHAAIAEDF
jgi:hypothetical protein